MSPCTAVSTAARALLQDLSFTERQEPPQHVFSNELSHLDGSYVLGVCSLIVVSCVAWICVPACVRDQIHSYSSAIFAVGSFSFFENISCVKKEATLFWEISSGPLDCQNVKNSELSSPLSRTCEGNDCVQMILCHSKAPRHSWAPIGHAGATRHLSCCVLVPS